MYSWNDSLDDWARPGAYRFDSARSAERASDARAAAAHGPRTYSVSGPDESLINPGKTIQTQSPTPLLVAVDVTGSMQTWPKEIFDRLPLLYNTLSQYRPELDVAFAAIGDAYCDRWPLQVTPFSHGFTLETQLKALYGEGGGGDAPESYELFAYWVQNHVKLHGDMNEKPFLIVFGDAEMHTPVRKNQVRQWIGDDLTQDQDAFQTWKRVAETWNVWFLRRAGRAGDAIDKQWKKAIGEQKVLHMKDEQRAVDYAMGLIARSWGHFEDFRTNMLARQTDGKVASLEAQVRAVPTRALTA